MRFTFGTRIMSMAMATVLSVSALVLPIVDQAQLEASAASSKQYTATIFNTGEYLTVTKNDAPVRVSASNQGNVYMKMEKGALLKAVGSVKNEYGNTWYQVNLNGKIYYLYSGNVKKNSNTTKADLIQVTKQNARLRKAPANTATTIQKFTKGSILYSVGTVVNKWNNSWEIVKLEGDSNLYYIYSGNVATSYDCTSGNIYLDVDRYKQSLSYSCSAASALTVLRHRNTALNVNDKTLQKKTNTYVYATVNVLNQYLGKNTYRWSIFTSKAKLEAAIRKSLAQSSPVIARLSFSKKYFNYNSAGHYSTIVGIYTDQNGKLWLQFVDSYAHNYKSNQYTNANTSIVNVPFDVVYQYASYGGASDRYFIYNP